MKAFLGCVVGTMTGMLIVPICASAQTDSGSALSRQVGALLTSHCVSCHGPEQKKGGLDLSRRATVLAGGKSGTAIVPGMPDDSLLIDKIAEGEMPPKEALAREQVAAVRDWVKAGAHYESEPLAPRRAGADWWSLRPIKRVSPPLLQGPQAEWAQTPVDAFILAGLKSRGLTPAPAADRTTLIRRLTFDLTGLPPIPQAVDAFAADPDPQAYDKLVDRLLASPQYGERWGRHWLDIVRFGESQGYETNLPRPSAWPYRDYVIRAFNNDIPYPRFVLEQLAGDTAGQADWLTQAATGFLVGGTHDIVGNLTIEGTLQQRADDLDDMITATGTTFLGLTVQCARCHDHKFDPIGQKDYYSLQAVFAGVEHAEREVPAADGLERRRQSAAVLAELATIDRQLDEHEPLAQPGVDKPGRPMVNPRRNVERFAPVRARMVRLTILATSDRTEPCIDEIEVYTAASGEGQKAEPKREMLGAARTSITLPGGGRLARLGGQDGRPPKSNVDAKPINVALATSGGVASATSEYPNSTSHRIVHLNDGRLGNGRSWISNVPGKGSVTIAWPEPALIDRVVWGRDRDQVYRDRLAVEYYVEAAVDPEHWQVVASSLDRRPFDPNAAGAKGVNPRNLPAGLAARQAELRQRLSQLGSTIKVYAGSFRQPGPTHLLVRGDPTRKGPEVRPAGVATVSPALVLDPLAKEADRRVALARWIVDPANPLPARVMVNRVWQYHFGRGIVATPGDFGFNGASASHPELLDWLASTYLDGGWRLKPIHRLIVCSAAYRQSSRLDNIKAQGVDRDNRLLWRMSPRRLEAESIRDAILAVSGRLDTRMGGPGYNIWEPNSNYVAVYKPRDELGPDAFRRMVYQFKPRSQADPTFGAFDCPDAALVAPRRNVSTTALQALNLLNSRFVIRQAACFAERLEAEAGPDLARQAELGFRLAFGRAPSSSERDAAVALIGSHGADAFCRALYNANEFVYVP